MSYIKRYNNSQGGRHRLSRPHRVSPEKPQHFLRWVESLGKPPKVPLRHKLEYIFKISGMRYIEFPGKKVTLCIHLFVNALERNKIIDYDMGEKSYYYATCEILRVEGPGVSDKKSPAIITAKITYIKQRIVKYKLPEKYKEERNLEINAKIPNEGAIVRILFDPKKTVDPFEGILLYCKKKPIYTSSMEEITLYVPPKYEPLLAEVQASNLTIGRLPT